LTTDGSSLALVSLARAAPASQRPRTGGRRRGRAASASSTSGLRILLPITFFFPFMNGETVAPARRRSPRTTAAPGFIPASYTSFLPPTPPSLFNLVVATTDLGKETPKGGHTGSRLGIFIGRLLGFEGASGRCRCGTGGDAAASGAPARQGAAPMAGVSTAVLPPPRHRHEAR
jgi:hypothetical protein